MLINELGRSIQADRQRDIEERLRQRGLLEDAESQAQDAAEARRQEFSRAGSKRPRAVGVRSSGLPAHGRPR